MPSGQFQERRGGARWSAGASMGRIVGNWQPNGASGEGISGGILVAWYLGQNRWEQDVERHKRHSLLSVNYIAPLTTDVLPENLTRT